MHIDWFTFTAQVVNFLVLVFLLQRFLYKPIVKAMDEREQKIASRLEEAERNKREAEQEAEAFRKKNKELAEKYDEMIAHAKAEAETRRKEFLQKAIDEVEAIQVRWREGILREMDAFISDLRQRVCKEVFSIARRALEDLAKADLEQRLIDLFLERVEGMNEDMRQAITESVGKANSRVVIQSAFDIPADGRQKIAESLRRKISQDGINLQYETLPDMIFGVELKAQSRKIAWSLESYLETLEESVTEAFQKETKKVFLQKEAEKDQEAIPQ